MVKAAAKNAVNATHRALWSGSLSFGLLNIPIALVGAKEADPISFSLLDKRDFGHIGYRRYNKNTGKEVPGHQIAKGYEYRDGKYVIVTDEDFRRANPRAVSTIDLEDFVDFSDLDPMLFSHAYYLVPGKNGEKGYRLLREVMEQTEKVAIGKVVLFRKHRLVAIMPRGDYLVLEVMRFAREVLTIDEMSDLAPQLKGVKISPREVEMAEALVQSMSAKWNPNKYRDTYSEDLLKLIAAKAKKGAAIEAIEPREVEHEISHGKVVDLMPLLKKSLRAGKRLKHGA